jgi:hypothetical protein
LISRREERRPYPPSLASASFGSDGRGDEARRRGDRFDGTGKVERLCGFDGRLDGFGGGDGYLGRQHESNGSDERTIRVVAAGHGAGDHSGHVVAAIHVIGRRSGSFVVMVAGDRALPGYAASGLNGGPSGSGERGVEQNDDEQTDTRENLTPTKLGPSGHGWTDIW